MAALIKASGASTVPLFVELCEYEIMQTQKEWEFSNGKNEAELRGYIRAMRNLVKLLKD